MTDEARVRKLLRSAFPPVVDQQASRDLWPLVVDRIQAPVTWSWLDIGLAAILAIVLLMFPEWLFLIAYHL